jgi:hypothetical protein
LLTDLAECYTSVFLFDYDQDFFLFKSLLNNVLKKGENLITVGAGDDGLLCSHYWVTGHIDPTIKKLFCKYIYIYQPNKLLIYSIQVQIKFVLLKKEKIHLFFYYQCTENVGHNVNHTASL